MVRYVTASAAPSGTTATTTTTTLALTIPAHNNGDMLVCVVGVKPDTATITTPGGWTNPSGTGELAGGGGTTGADTGPTRIKAFYKVGDGTTETLNITLSGQNVAWGQILVFRADSAGWDASPCSAAVGADTTTGTPLTAAMGADPGLLAQDGGVVAACIPTDVSTPSQFSSPTLTGTGMTATVTERSEPDSTSNNDIGGFVGTFEVTASLTSGVPTVSITAGGTTTNVRGPIIVFRVREAARSLPKPSRHMSVAAMSASTV